MNDYQQFLLNKQPTITPAVLPSRSTICTPPSLSGNAQDTEHQQSIPTLFDLKVLETA